MWTTRMTLWPLVHVLENADFRVKAFSTSDDALIALQTESPNLIISDISLETSFLGGFAFYEKIRQMDHLLDVPFIFLSGMSDEGMIRYGKGLGADDIRRNRSLMTPFLIRSREN